MSVDSDFGSEYLGLLKSRLSRLREQLLDLTNRNRLLSFKHSERARTHIRVIDELPDFLFGALKQGQTLTFESLPEPDNEPDDELTPQFRTALEAVRLTDEEYKKAAGDLETKGAESDKAASLERELRDRVRDQLGMPPWTDETRLRKEDFARLKGLDPSYELPAPQDSGDSPERHHDSLIQTFLYPAQMERKLSGIVSNTRTLLQETGISALYAAFGFLEWREDRKSGRRHFAPLLLLPVTIEPKRSRPRRKFILEGAGEDVETNRTLAIRLGKDFGFDLPELDEQDTPETYFERVESAIAGRAGWAVRRFVTIGMFGFSKLAMYNDPVLWPVDGESQEDYETLQNELIRRLFFGMEDEAGAGGIELPEPPAGLIDEEAERIPLVKDADASQHGAIIDALAGKSMVIRGPPGTGKSQTITNLIGAFLAAGKRVLFVAEKLAAVEVVEKNLKDAKLEPFCLQVHSSKTRKQAVLKSIANTLEARESIQEVNGCEIIEGERTRSREFIADYIGLVTAEVGGSGKTAQQAFWAYRRAQMEAGEAFQRLDGLRFPRALEMDQQELAAAAAAIENVFTRRSEILGEFGNENQHPWSWVREARIDPFKKGEILKESKEWKDVLSRLAASYQIVDEAPNSPDSVTLGDIEKVMGASIPEMPTEEGLKIASACRGHEACDAMRHFLESIRTQGTPAEASFIFLEGCFPPACDDWKNVGETICRSVAKICDYLPSARTLSQVDTDLESLRRYRSILLDLEEAHRFTQGICRSELPDTIAGSRVFILALKHLQEATDDFLALRNSLVLDPAYRPHLSRAHEMAQRAFADRLRLELTLVTNPLPTPEELAGYATALRSAGALGFARSDVRQAKQYFRGRCLVRKKFSHEEMAELLTRFAEYATLVRQLSEDPTLNKVCGNSFQGINTNFGMFLEVADWADAVIRSLPPKDPAAVGLRALLFTGEINGLKELRQLSPDSAALDTVLASIDQFPGKTRLSKVVSEIERQIENLGSRLNQTQNAMMAASATADKKFAASLS